MNSTVMFDKSCKHIPGAKGNIPSDLCGKFEGDTPQVSRKVFPLRSILQVPTVGRRRHLEDILAALATHH